MIVTREAFDDYIRVSSKYALSVYKERAVFLLEIDDIRNDREIQLEKLESMDDLVNGEKGYEYFVEAKATHEDLSRLLALQEQAETIKAEIDKIKGNLLLDAELSLQDTRYNSVEIKVPEGFITVTNKATVSVLNAGFLKGLLRDADDEFVTMEPAKYKVSSILNKVLCAAADDDFLPQTPQKFIEDLIAQSELQGTDYKSVRKVLRQNYESNVKVFMNVFRFTEQVACQKAADYQKTLNYELLCKIAVVAGYDLNSAAWLTSGWQSFKEQLLSAIDVRRDLAVKTKLI